MIQRSDHKDYNYANAQNFSPAAHCTPAFSWRTQSKVPRGSEGQSLSFCSEPVQATLSNRIVPIALEKPSKTAVAPVH